jgi:hypothetical protein
MKTSCNTKISELCQAGNVINDKNHELTSSKYIQDIINPKIQTHSDSFSPKTRTTEYIHSTKHLDVAYLKLSYITFLKQKWLLKNKWIIYNSSYDQKKRSKKM